MKRIKLYCIVIFAFVAFLFLNYAVSVIYTQNVFALTEQQEDDILLNSGAFDNIEFGLIKASDDFYAFMVMYLDDKAKPAFLQEDSVINYDFFHLKIIDMNADSRSSGSIDLSVFAYEEIIYNATNGNIIGYKRLRDYSTTLKISSNVQGYNIYVETSKDVEYIRIEYLNIWFLFQHKTLKENIPIPLTRLTQIQQQIIYGVVTLIIFIFALSNGWLISRKAKRLEIPPLIISISIFASGLLIMLFIYITRAYLWSQFIYVVGLLIVGTVLGTKLYVKEFEKMHFWVMNISNYQERAIRKHKILTFEYYFVQYEGDTVKAIIKKGFKNSLFRLFGKHVFLYIDNEVSYDRIEFLNYDELAHSKLIPVDYIKMEGKNLMVKTTSPLRMDSRTYGHKLIAVLKLENKLKGVEMTLARLLGESQATDYNRVSCFIEEIMQMLGLEAYMRADSKIDEKILDLAETTQNEVDKYAKKLKDEIAGDEENGEKKKR
jgi:lipid-A-disaccharide synthase-like uncharacterized protein